MNTITYWGVVMKVGFIEPGYPGKTIARRLISEGADLMAWNKTYEKGSDLEGDMAATPAELISIIF